MRHLFVGVFLLTCSSVHVEGQSAKLADLPPDLKAKLTTQAALRQNTPSGLHLSDDAQSYVYRAASSSEHSLRAAYTAKLGNEGSQGVEVTGGETELSIQLLPVLPGLGSALRSGDTLSYRTADGLRLDYSFKRNGVKEDIVLSTPPSRDLALQYLVRLDPSLEARLDGKGNLLVYGPSGALSGFIQTGDEESAQLVMKARARAPRDRLLYIVPAPVVVDAGRRESPGLAHFTYDPPILTIHNADLSSLPAPVSIDPSIVVTTTSDFRAGNDEGMISFDTDAISRAVQSGGTLRTWNATGAFPTARSGHASVAHNGYLYLLGGRDSTGTVLDDVRYAPLNSDGTVGTWNATTSFSTARSGHASVAYNGYLYVLGGSNYTGTVFNDVQYAPITSTGPLGTWSATTSFATARYLHTSVASNGYLYVLGGYGTGYLDDVQYAPTNADGTLGTWSATTSFQTPRHLHTSVAVNGYLYVIGGFDGTYLADVQFAPLGSNGTVGAWKATAGLPTARALHASVAYAGHIYVLGGYTTGYVADVLYGPINSNGTVGIWNTTASIPTARGAHTSVAYNNCLYLLGGSDGASLNDVYYGRLDSPGVVSRWSPTTSFASPRYGHSSVAYNGFLYVLGGSNDVILFDDVRFAPLGPDGTVGAWTSTTSFSVARFFHTSVAYNGYLYVLGGSDSTTAMLDDVQYAPLAANGTVGAWTATTSFPVPRRGHTSVAYNGRLYVLGGYDGSVFLNDVRYASIAADGTVGAWSGTTTFTGSRAYHASVAYNGKLYVLGGGGGTYDDVQFAAIAANGTLGAWNATTSLPGPRIYLSSVAYNGHLYVLAGDGSYSNDVHYAPIAANGTVGAWNATTSFDTGRYGHTAVATNGHLYVMGGWSSTGARDDVQYSSMAVNGTVTAWTATSGFATARTAHTSLAYNGYLYVIGGWAGGPRNDVQYAPIAADGSVGPWNPTTSFDTARHDHTSIAHNGYLYILGGYSFTFLNHVGYAPIASDGTIGAWNTTTSFPTARRFHTSVVHNGYVYVMGGSNSSGHLNDVRFAPIASNGTIGAWSATTSFDIARSAHASLVYGGNLYVIGGDSAGGYLDDVQYAPIASNGTVGTWQATTSFDVGRFRHAAVAYNGSLYVIGGYGGVNRNDVQHAPIASNGAVGSWSRTTGFSSARNHHRAVVYRGHVYVLGGHDGTLRNDVQYTTLNGPAARGIYSRLVNTGVASAVASIQLTGSAGTSGAVNLTFMTAGTSGVFGPRTSIANAVSGAVYPVNGCGRYLWASFELDDTSSTTTDSGWTLGRKDVLDFTITYTPLTGASADPLLGTKATAVRLSWASVPGASYNVKRCTYSGGPCTPTTIATVSGTTWDDFVLGDAASYWYSLEPACP